MVAIRRGIAILLLVSGILKIAALFFANGVEPSPLWPIWVILSASFIEIALAMRLLRANVDLITRLATSFLFLIFAAASLVSLHSGAHSCSCFGPIALAPAYVFWADIIISFVMLFDSVLEYRGERTGRQRRHGVMPPILAWAICFLAILNSHLMGVSHAQKSILSLVERGAGPVVVVRSSCDDCRKLIANIDRLQHAFDHTHPWLANLKIIDITTRREPPALLQLQNSFEIETEPSLAGAIQTPMLIHHHDEQAIRISQSSKIFEYVLEQIESRTYF